MRSSRILALVLAGAAVLGLSPAGAQVHPLPPQEPIPACLLSNQFNSLPVGPSLAPADAWADQVLFHMRATESNDYHWIHSSVHLQGAGALQKWGACLFFNPDPDEMGPIDMTDWRSALIINNPSRGHTVHATITYRDPQGNALGPIIPVTLGPEQTFVRGAIELRRFGPGIGSVEVNADHPIVGATLHHFNQLRIPNRPNGQLVKNLDIAPGLPIPGANSMQQLQMSQEATTLFSGPFPISNSSAEDFLNGVLPVNCVLNPNPTPTILRVGSTVTSSQNVFLPPFGMFLDSSLWSFAETKYLSNPPAFDMDAISFAFSNGNPILGDFLMVDVFGNGPPMNKPGDRFRMGSGMMQNAPASLLINPEHTETGPFAQPPSPGQTPLPKTPPVETMMSVANVSGSDIGPVTVEFFARTGGAPKATLSFPSLPPLAVQRITPATSAIPENFAGWARITACGPGLIGWTMREVWQQQTVNPVVPHFHEVFGEELEGANGGEPGPGIPVQIGQTWISKVAPLLRAGKDAPGNLLDWWPGYVNGVNSGVKNLGSYWHRFFTLDTGALVGQQNFPGLSFANTSFTYVDPIVNVTADTNISGRFDTTAIGASGMEAIGDPLFEWRIDLFLGSDVEAFLQEAHEP